MNNLSDLENQIKDLIAQRQRVVADYQTYHANISNHIQKTLRDAGVWEIVNSMEVGRERRRAEDQDRVNSLGARISALEKEYSVMLDAPVDDQPQSEDR